MVRRGASSLAALCGAVELAPAGSSLKLVLAPAAPVTYNLGVCYEH